MATRDIFARLVRLGGEYERADQARDYAAKVKIAERIDRVCREIDYDAVHVPLVRGRNHIRRLRGQDDDIHV